MKRIVSAIALAIVLWLPVQAQTINNAGEKPDGPYPQTQLNERKVIPYPSIREADVLYAKRIERIIDSREKKNQVMNWPKSALNKIIFDMVNNGEPNQSGQLRAYRNDSMTSAITIAEIAKIGGHCETIQMQRPGSTDIYDLIHTTICTPYDFTMIKRWKVVEDWLFDKQRGMFFPRIIALAPMYQPELNGVALPEQPMFYIKYTDLRPLIVNKEVFNRESDGTRLSYYDFFEQRMFSSYIVKESNDKDYAIKDFDEYKNDPMGALYESERIKNDMFQWESDLWEY